MKYSIVATYTFDHYIEFDSEKMYTKDGLLEIVSNVLSGDSETKNKFNPRINWNVGSGMDIEYTIEKGEE